MTGGLLTEPVLRAIGADGLAMSGALLQFYVTGTTTPTNVFTTSALSVARTNPVVADSGGLFPVIFLDPNVTYRVQLKTSGGSLILDIDPFTIQANIATGSIDGALLAAGAVNYELGYTAADDAGVMKIGRHQMFIKADALIPRTTNGPAAGSTETATNKVMITGYDFDASTAEYAQIMFPVPKSVTITSFTYRLRWTAISGSGVVVWAVQAAGRSDDDAMDQAFGTAVTVNDTVLSTSDQHTTVESGTVTVGGSPSAQDMLVLQVYRDASNGSDTLAADARLLAIELFLTVAAATDT